MKTRKVAPGVSVAVMQPGEEVRFDTKLGTVVLHFNGEDLEVGADGAVALVVMPRSANRVRIRTEALHRHG